MKVIYTQNTMYRKEEYAISTQIVESEGQRFVLKKALNNKAIPFVNGMEKNYQELVKQYSRENIAKGELLSPGVFRMEYIDGEALDVICMRLLENGNYNGFFKNIEYYYNRILANYTDEIIPVNDFNPMSPNRKYNLDLTLNNIIVLPSGKIKIIDYEWLLPNISKKFELFRTVAFLYGQYKNIFKEKQLSQGKLLEICGFSAKDIELHNKQEENFEAIILDWNSKKNERKTIKINF